MSEFKSILEELKIPSPPSLIKEREGPKGKMLNYMEWYTYADILDTKCKHGWHTEIMSVTAADGVVSVAVRLWIDGIYKDNVGSEETTHSDPAASAFAQAFKRCCAMFGLGRDLYRNPEDLTWDQLEAVTDLIRDNDIEDEHIERIKKLLEKSTADGGLTRKKANAFLKYYGNDEGV